MARDPQMPPAPPGALSWAPPAGGGAPLWLDQVGAGLSLACAGHCLGAPLLLALGPVAGRGFLADEGVESLLLGLALLLATGSLCWGFRQHRHRRPVLLLGLALLLGGGGRMAPTEPLETLGVVLAAGLLAGGHLLNRRLCRTCRRCQAPDGERPGRWPAR